MPAIGEALYNLVKNNIHNKMKDINGQGPLSLLKDKSYFEEFCQAIGKGIAEGSPTVNFTTADTGLKGLPLITGPGMGTGILVDSEYMTKALYTKIRSTIIAQFGKTLHDTYPPKDGNSGKYLESICRGIAEAVQKHYKSAYILTSTHPIVYSGTGKVTKYSGLNASTIKSLILNYSPRLKGPFWPTMAQAIAEGYVDGIHNGSTGNITITGVCVPSPLPPQVCGIPGSGTGTGVAA